MSRADLLAIPDADLREGRVQHAILVHMDFLDAPRRWWTGWGDMEHDGYVWQGTGDLISIAGLESNYSLNANQVTFSMTATPEMVANALEARARVRGRDVTVSLGLFAEGAPSPMASFALFAGTMERMPWALEGTTNWTLTLECEGLFARRNAPPRGRWTDADQKARHSGDKGFERLPLYANGYETKWRG
ncbi:hypothetical protein [Thioclava kandeliae]|uniref:DUF2163 domain-containing protein n=1 Tax=Thioclava kandeliae TaxID=3070818 RepID=A0ABV1SIU4_9RHOB